MLPREIVLRGVGREGSKVNITKSCDLNVNYAPQTHVFKGMVPKGAALF